MPDQDVRFELKGIAPDLNVGGPDGAFMTFTVGGVKVLVAHAVEGDNATDDSRLIVETTRTLSKDVLRFLVTREEYLASNETHAKGPRGLEPEQLAWMLSPPGELVSAFSFVAAELRAAATRLVQTLRWVLHKTETVQPLTRESLYWSRDGDTWYSAPPQLNSGPSFIGNFDRHTLDFSSAEILQRLLDQEDFAEPFGRQILLEAGALLEGNPRAACVLAVTAAEVGMKQFVARMSRSSEAWLISEVQSPPLPKLMSEYFQHLLASSDREEKAFAIPKRLRKTIQDGTEWRNRIVHRGVDPPSPEELEELLHAVDEFLYTLDWAAGHHWAAMWLPTELRPTEAGP